MVYLLIQFNKYVVFNLCNNIFRKVNKPIKENKRREVNEFI